MARLPTVLVVDDEIQIQRLLKLGLGAGRFKVVSARTASEALSVFAQEEPDLVVLDLGLPDGSGFDVLTEIRKISQAPIIILSVRENEKEKVRAFEAGDTCPYLRNRRIGRLQCARATKLRIAKNR